MHPATAAHALQFLALFLDQAVHGILCLPHLSLRCQIWPFLYCSPVFLGTSSELCFHAAIADAKMPEQLSMMETKVWTKLVRRRLLRNFYCSRKRSFIRR